MKRMSLIGAVCLAVSGCAVNYHPTGFLGRAEKSKVSQGASDETGTASGKRSAASPVR